MGRDPPEWIQKVYKNIIIHLKKKLKRCEKCKLSVHKGNGFGGYKNCTWTKPNKY